jgi:hypothetical protein
MQRTFTNRAVGCVAAALALGAIAAACGRADLYRWDGTDASAEQDGGEADWVSLYEAVDILLVVDDSDSMDEEQVILGTSLFGLINGLVNPLPSAGLQGGLDDVRVAVISTDLGLSWGGNPYQDEDGWPTNEVPCTSIGDDGVFRAYVEDKQIKVKDGVIACDESDAQCPIGWACDGIGADGVGTCAAPFGDVMVDCPWMSGAWAQSPTPAELPNPYVATQVACMTSLGTQGCGFEQHLRASQRALTRPDQLTFVRDEALLAVIIVSDEDDCSLESSSFFWTPEIQDLPQYKVNIACGEHPEHLYSTSVFRQAFLDVKGGDPSALLFAAVVGVPIDGACQGWGDEIEGCLDHAQMQLEYDIIDDPIGDLWYYQPACTRWADDVEVTRAAPARRLVELALDFGNRGYVYSICNADWSKAMNDLAAKIPLK